MGVFKDRGLVLKEIASGEYDKAVIALLEERGKARIFVKGAKNPKSKLNFCSGLFCWSDFVMYDGNGFLSLNQASLIDNHYAIRNDYDSFLRASFMLELAEKILPAQAGPGPVLGLLLKTFAAFCRPGAGNSEFVFNVFLLKLLEAEGYAPEFGLCSSCRNEVSGRAFIAEAGLVCENCAAGLGRLPRVDREALGGLRYIFERDLDSLYRLNAKKEILSGLSAITSFLVEANFDVKLKSGGLF